jgi:hypothetical protein
MEILNQNEFKFMSLDDLKKYLFLILSKEQNKAGVPIFITFLKNTEVIGNKLDKKNQLLVNLFTNKNKTEIYIKTKSTSKTFFDYRILPFSKIINIELHPNYRPFRNVPISNNKGEEIIRQLFNFINLNDTKTIVFEFSDYVYLPNYDLVPLRVLKIDVGVLKLCWDSSKNFKPYVIFYSKNSKKTFYKADYFPFDTCSNWENVENHMYKEAKKSLKNIPGKITPKIRVKTTKSKDYKEIIISSEAFIDKEKISNLYPLIYALKFNKTIDRTHENCLVCGAKLFSDEQTFVHLLTDGNLISNPDSKISNHFNYFPVGKECLSLIPIDYHFSKFDLIKANRK